MSKNNLLKSNQFLSFLELQYLACAVILIAVIFLLFLMVPFFNYKIDAQLIEQEKSSLSTEDSNPIELNSEEFKLPNQTNSGGLNLIFFADQYSSWEEFEYDINSLMSEIKTIEPWKSYSYFNIYKINSKSKDICYVWTDKNPSLRCLPRINDYLENLPLKNFKLIVLSKQVFLSWANSVRNENSGIFMSMADPPTEGNKIEYTLFFANFLGSSFGLKYEGLISFNSSNESSFFPNGPNCAPDETTAKKWWGHLAEEYSEVGYFKGCCGNENYIKPTDSSIMNPSYISFPLSYGPVSEEYLNKVLAYCYTPGNKISQKEDYEFFKRYPEFINCTR
jgi:hypothetical protein